MSDITVKDKVFTEFISKEEMNLIVTSLAKKVEIKILFLLLC